jgi:hypothetical protein
MKWRLKGTRPSAPGWMMRESGEHNRKFITVQAASAWAAEASELPMP